MSVDWVLTTAFHVGKDMTRIIKPIHTLTNKVVPVAVVSCALGDVHPIGIL
jgi:hypothetical protein